MGWFWNKNEVLLVSDAPPAIQTRQPSSSSSSSSSTASAPSPLSPKPNSSSFSSFSPQEPADTQIARFLAMAENPGSASTTPHSTTAGGSSSSSEYPSAYNADETPADSQLPTTMSCRQAFDLATACQGMAGQLRHVYRYGEFRSCSAHWADFWFCMRAKGAGDGPGKEAMIRAHYREKEKEKYHDEGKRSSEDVWRPRERKVPEDAFFNEPINPPVVDHDEWRRTELERRRKIRETCEKDERQR